MTTLSSAKKPSIVSWLMAARPKTLSTAIMPVFMGTFLAYSKGGVMDWMVPVYALFVALFITIGTNLVNDALDFKKGTDTSERLGFTRMTQSGMLTVQQVLMAGIICYSVALLFGIPLILKGGLPIVALLLLSVICGYLYTGGPYPLSYTGVADFFVVIFYGFVAVGAVYYLQTGSLDAKALLAGAQAGLLATVLIAINNLRDIVSDGKANKRTLAVRFGVTFGRCEITLCALLPFVLGGFWITQGHFYAALLPWLAFPLSQKLIRNIWTHEPSRVYNSYFGMASLLLVFFELLLSVGLQLG